MSGDFPGLTAFFILPFCGHPLCCGCLISRILYYCLLVVLLKFSGIVLICFVRYLVRGDYPTAQMSSKTSAKDNEVIIDVT